MAAILYKYNSEVDAINTCMPSSALPRDKPIVAAIGNYYQSLNIGVTLRYKPSVTYYYQDYSVDDQHSMSYVYNWVNHLFDSSNPTTYSLIKISDWPIGIEKAYFNYMSYYGLPNQTFGDHNLYWQQYTSILWDQNPALHPKFDNDLTTFQDFYYFNELHYIGAYLDSVDVRTLPSNEGLLTQTVSAYPSGLLDDCAISGTGDINRDGIPDFIIGGRYSFSSGGGLCSLWWPRWNH